MFGGGGGVMSRLFSPDTRTPPSTPHPRRPWILGLLFLMEGFRGSDGARAVCLWEELDRLWGWGVHGGFAGGGL